jgi:divalent metal cation (Fe/Co/Zn/Cd) transporter
MPAPIQPPWRAALLALGAIFLAAGLLWPWISRYVGRLPGDIVVRRDGWTFAFPIVTSLVVSVLLSLLLWLLRK